MEDQDVVKLDKSERKLLDLSFETGFSESRIRNIVINLGFASAAVILAAVYGIRVPWLVAFSVAILVISAIEKISYARTLLHYDSLVRKLVHRVEQLEGTRPTAFGSQPAARVERQLHLDQPRA